VEEAVSVRTILVAMFARFSNSSLSMMPTWRASKVRTEESSRARRYASAKRSKTVVKIWPVRSTFVRPTPAM
jgi:hypothetical protein